MAEEKLTAQELFTEHERLNLQYAIFHLPPEGQDACNEILMAMAQERLDLRKRLADAEHGMELAKAGHARVTELEAQLAGIQERAKRHVTERREVIQRFSDHRIMVADGRAEIALLERVVGLVSEGRRP